MTKSNILYESFHIYISQQNKKNYGLNNKIKSHLKTKLARKTTSEIKIFIIWSSKASTKKKVKIKKKKITKYIYSKLN